MKFPSYGLVYDYSLEDGGVSRKHSKDDDDEDDHTEEVRGQIWHLKDKRKHDFIDLTRAESKKKHYQLSSKLRTLKLSPVFILLKNARIVVSHLEYFTT